jgi:hypothetical protein
MTATYPTVEADPVAGSALTGETTARVADVDAEETRAKIAEALKQDASTAATDAELAAEAARAAAAEATKQDASTAATDTELGAEATARANADTALNTAISTEATARSSADSTHAALTTGVHGIAATTLLATYADLRDLGNIVTRHGISALSASTWMPIFVAPTACQVRSVSYLPAGGDGTIDASNYWWGNLQVYRFDTGQTVIPSAQAAAADLIARKQIIGPDNRMVAGQPWDWGSVAWSETAAILWPGDVLGVFWARTGAPGNIQGTGALPSLYTTRVAPVAVTA